MVFRYGGNADDLGCGCFNPAPSGCDSACGSTATLDECGVCDDDSSNDCVQDCAGTWGGDATKDDCSTCDSDGTNNCVTVTVSSSSSTSATVSYDSEYDIAGFQFSVSGASLTGGDSDLGETTVTPSMVLAFDFSGGYLAAGSGTLATLSFDESVDGIDLTLSGIILSSTAGLFLS